MENEKLKKPSVYEKQQIDAITTWEKESPSVVNKAFGVVSKPVVWGVQKLVPQKAIEGALNFANGAGNFLADSKDILRDGKVSSIEELKHVNLEFCDGLAKNVHNWALGFAAVEGGAAGWLGLPGMAIDIPALITFSLRTIHKIGLCYGYEAKTAEDEQFVMMVLSSAGANNAAEKAASVLAMREIQQTILKQTWKKMAQTAAEKQLSKEAGIVAAKNLAKQLGINITKRKALQAIPVIGAAIGATMNVQYVNDICWAARRSFQKRWLEENMIEM